MFKTLRRLRDRLFGKPKAPKEVKPKQKKTPLYINLGIDFGTSFTKVCYRDVGREASGIVDFSSQHSSWPDALIPSLIRLGPSGKILAAIPAPNGQITRNGWATVDQIKMRLAGLDLQQELGNFFVANP